MTIMPASMMSMRTVICMYDLFSCFSFLVSWEFSRSIWSPEPAVMQRNGRMMSV